MEAPKGISASLASLKHCIPKGMPIMVMQKSNPLSANPKAIGKPVTISHRIFIKMEAAPPPYTTSLPKGIKERLANLKHCRPMGMPIMVQF